jgi:hypothetical protein
LHARYERSSGDICCEVISFFTSIRFQTLPEQKNRPNAQASTRSEFGPFIAIVA